MPLTGGGGRGCWSALAPSVGREAGPRVLVCWARERGGHTHGTAGLRGERREGAGPSAGPRGRGKRELGRGAWVGLPFGFWAGLGFGFLFLFLFSFLIQTN